MEHVRRTSRLLAVLAGVLGLSVASSMVWESFAQADLTTVAEELFPPVAQPGAGTVFDGDQPGFAMEPELQDIEVDVELTEEGATGEVVLLVPASSWLARDAAEGWFMDEPEQFVQEFAGELRFRVHEDLVRLSWGPPVVTRGSGDMARVAATGRVPMPLASALSRAGAQASVEVLLDLSTAYCREGCRALLDVRADDFLLVTAVQVEGDIRTQSSQHLRADLASGARAAVTLFPTVPSRDVPTIGGLVASFATYLWPMAPWIALYAVLRRNLIGGAGDRGRPEEQRAWVRLTDRFYLILALGAVTVAAVGVTTFLGASEVIGAMVSENDDTRSFPLPEGLWWLGPGALEAAFVIWAVAALTRSGRRAPRVVASVAVVTALAVGLLWLALDVSSTAWLLGGLGLAVGACLVCAWGMARRPGQVALAALAGLAVLVLVTGLSATWSPRAIVTAFVVSALTTGAMLLALARVALGDLLRIAARSRGVRLVGELAAVIALLLIVLPTVRPTDSGPREELASASAIYALRSVVPLALILTAVIVLRARAFSPAAVRPLPWAVVVLLSGALVLRPEVLYAGIPWSFAVGMLLLVVVVFPRRSTWGSDWTPAEEQNSPALIGATLRRSTKAATYHQLQDTLRKKVAAADLSTEDAETTRQAVVQAFGELPRRPSSAALRQAFNWAGEANAWRRAVSAGAAATVVGLVLQFGTLAETVAQMSEPFGSRPWGTVAAAGLAFRFPLYGFVFGYFLPLIPGSTGLLKALRLLVVLAGSESVLLLVPFGDSGTVEAVTVRLLQMLVVCLVLGVGADYLALRRCGCGAEGLRDIYHTSRFVLWGSGVAVAAATALATALAGSAMSLLVERIVPGPTDQQVSQSDQRDTGGDGP